MNTHQTNFVRTSMLEQSTPPVLEKGYIAWIRKKAHEERVVLLTECEKLKSG